MNRNIEPFEPITKERASAIIQVSIRTLDYWVQQGEMPMPVKLGRRCYWHPNVFYPWLAIRMNQNVVETAEKPIEAGQPETPQVESTEAPLRSQTASSAPIPNPRRRFRQPSTNVAIKRQQERIKSLNVAP